MADNQDAGPSGSNTGQQSTLRVSTPQEGSGGSGATTPTFRQKPIEQLRSIASILIRLREELPNIADTDLKSLAKDQLEINLLYLAQKSNMTTQPSASSAAIGLSEQELVVGATIPTAILRQIERIPKLSRSNWHGWCIDVKSILRPYPVLLKHLVGLVDPSDPDYNVTVDHSLVGLIRASAEHTSSENVRYILDSRPDWTGSALFRALRTELTKDDKVKASQVLMDLTRLRVIDNDIERLIIEMDEVGRRATLLGKNITDEQRVTQLANVSRYGPFASTWEQLDTMGVADQYENVVSALLARAHGLKMSALAKERRSAALAATSTTGNSASFVASNNSNNSVRTEHTPKYWLGKAGKDGKAHCYGCGQEGHIRKNCPGEKKAVSTKETPTAVVLATASNKEDDSKVDSS